MNDERRSSISLRINSFTQAGGVNSIENFARSWQRAAGFVEIPPQRPAFVVNENEEDIIGPRRSDVDNIPKTHRSLLRNQLEQEEPNSESTLDEAENQNSGSGSQAGSKSRSFRQDDIISHAPYLASPFASNVGGGLYGSLSSRANESSMRHAGRLFQEQQARGAQEPDKEQQPLLVKRVERGDGKLVDVVVGQSTLPQTIFNSVNVLVGVGLLSLPLGFRYSGWLVGLVFLVFAAITTKYTAGILAKCLDIDDSLITFADLAYVSFGARARIAISFIFSIELIGACVALVVLFADSLDALIPGWGNTEWKVFCGLIMVPLGFVPLRFLSFTSVLGIISCFGSKPRLKISFNCTD